ncbi:MAG: Uma2 family endonuclease [Acidobacteriaceae bacterium]|nr:Uma2 family endonuclease [Acidobacteriaceae bacterium]
MATKTVLTLEQFCALPERGPDGSSYELSEGELVTLPPPGYKHGRVIAKITALLMSSVSEKFDVVAGDTGFLLNANPEAATVRGADVAVTLRSSLGGEIPEGWFPGGPLLAVEVVSPGNRAADMQLKVRQYLEAGGREVWLVYPATRTVYVYSAGRRDPQVLGEDDIIESVVEHKFRVADFFRV